MHAHPKILFCLTCFLLAQACGNTPATHQTEEPLEVTPAHNANATPSPHPTSSTALRMPYIPHKVILPPPLVVPDTDPPQKEITEWVTDIIVDAGGQYNQKTLEVPKKDTLGVEYDLIRLTGAMDDGEDFFNVDAPFDWTVSDLDVVGISMLHGLHDGAAYARGMVDILDTHTSKEPHATVTACAINTCPKDPSSCKPKVCISLEVTSVVNLNGTWQFSGVSFDTTPVAEIKQTGRRFLVPALDIDSSIVVDDNVEFHLNDNVYNGKISPDHKTISGIVWDQINDAAAGPWQATRLD